MKFQSNKGAFFTIILFGSLSIFSWIGVELLMANFDWISLFVFVLLLLTTGLLLWIYFDTSYKLNQEEFSYRSGPFRGKIEINRINEVIKGKTMWAGLKPATAQKGLIIKYDKYNEIYISPRTNDLFIETLLDLNSEIRITE